MALTRTGDAFLKDPAVLNLPNDGVAEVAEPTSDAQREALRFELETFVCEGQYADGLERILDSYLASLGKPTQPAVWVSGFYGSGKSHLVKMLRYLWEDYHFPDGATARGLAKLTPDISAALTELDTRATQSGGKVSASGRLSQSLSLRLAILANLFRGAGLPENYACARFVMFLRANGVEDAVRRRVQDAGKTFEAELHNLYVSPIIAQALLDAIPDFAEDAKGVRLLIKAQFPSEEDITDEDLRVRIHEALAVSGRLPCTLLVLDEVQQYIGDNADRALAVNNVAEVLAKHFEGQLLFVATGQSALAGTPLLQQLQGRFTVGVQLSDPGVETVTRKVVLAKKPECVDEIAAFLETCSGEIDRQVAGTQLASQPGDGKWLVADYPILPSRRRFWEHALRAVDKGGSKAQLRSQLRIVLEAAKSVAEEELGRVVPADFIFDQIATSLVTTSVLPKDTHDLILSLRQEDGDGPLASRLCALIWLIEQLPREGGSDKGLRATPEHLGDLLVEDIRNGSSQIRASVPAVLERLADSGKLILVDGEYHIQTRASADWWNTFQKCRAMLLQDPHRITEERSKLIEERCNQALKGLVYTQGESKTARKTELHFGSEPPSPKLGIVPVWIRDGWTAQERTVRDAALEGGIEDPTVYVYLPRVRDDETRKLIATWKAADETLGTGGVPSEPEGQQARAGMAARRDAARADLDSLLEQVLDGAIVLQGGGDRVEGATLRDAVLTAVECSCIRLYPKFGDADDPRWNKVLAQACKGDGSALSVLGFESDAKEHPVCAALLGRIAAGGRGNDLRKQFSDSPYGWPQDAIDGALCVLVASGAASAEQDGLPVNATDLNQRKIGNTVFRAASVTVSAADKLAVRKLIMDVVEPNCKPGEELSGVARLLNHLADLAQKAGGDPPAPPRPQTAQLDDLRALTGNELLAAVYERQGELRGLADEWKRVAAAIEGRMPAWRILTSLLELAVGLPEHDEVSKQVRAIEEGRRLLDEPDPVPPLQARLAGALRTALKERLHAYSSAYQIHLDALIETQDWKGLAEEVQSEILTAAGIAPAPAPEVGMNEELIESLRTVSLSEWDSRIAALPKRFADVRASMQKALHPEASTVQPSLPSATLRTAEDVEQYLGRVREALMEHVAAGRVVVL